MKQTLLILPIILLSFIERDKVKHSFETENIKCSYETSQGRIDGNYVSYYKNGQKKAEGIFENYYRIGKWTVWDSAGRVRMQRDYSDPFTFKRLLPEVPKNKVVELLNIPQYTIAYNKDGFIDFFELRERAVVWAKRIWRFATPSQNSLLFENDKLFSILNKEIFNKNITPYQVTNDEFENELLLTDLDTSAIKVVGYKIQEDCFFDNDRLVFESRIIGICPVVMRKNRPDTFDLYWVDFTQIRKYLAQAKIRQTNLPAKIKTFDDLLIYRYFYGQIYKESNTYDKPISAYKTGVEIEKEAERIEIGMIENEHDIWISFTE